MFISLFNILLKQVNYILYISFIVFFAVMFHPFYVKLIVIMF